jgi:hypothetical protein
MGCPANWFRCSGAHLAKSLFYQLLSFFPSTQQIDMLRRQACNFQFLILGDRQRNIQDSVFHCPRPFDNASLVHYVPMGIEPQQENDPEIVEK